MPASRKSRAVKTPRDQLLYLEVQTDDSPEVLLRILNLLIVHNRPPLGVSAKCGSRGQHIRITLEPFDNERAELLLRKIETIVSVARAEYSNSAA